MKKNNKKFIRGLSGLSICLMITLLSTCEKVPDYCGKGEWYNPDFQFCFANKAYPLCSNGGYNPLTEGCDASNLVGTMCVNNDVVPLGTPCGGYSLAIASAPADGGDITISRTSPGPNFAAGEQVTLVAQHRAGYEFAGWAGAQPSPSAAVTLTMDANKPMVAMFNPTTRTLATTAFPPAGGDITRTPNSDGTQVTVTAVPADGHTFTNWEGASTSTQATITVTVDEGKTLVAMFTPNRHSLMVNTNPANSGTVFVNGAASSETTTHDFGTRVDVVARPAAGYEFLGWTGASTSAVPEIIVTIGANQTLTANFQREGGAAHIHMWDDWIVTTEATCSEPGVETITCTLCGDTETREIPQLTGAQCDTAHTHSWGDWTVVTPATCTADGLETRTCSSCGETENQVIPQLTGAQCDTAHTHSWGSWTVVTPATCTADGLETRTCSSCGEIENQVIQQLSADDPQCQTPTYTLTVNRNPTAGGTVTPASQSGITAGTPVDISASPASGYRFVSWTVTGGGTVANPNNANTTVTLTANATVTAIFQQQTTGGGNVIEGAPIIDSRDNQTYRTVVIGTQTWMAENLNFAGHLFGESWCYGNVPDSCARYGRLYNWTAAMEGSLSSTAVPSGVQGACPAGWHLPSREEWNTLLSVAGGSSAGRNLKSSPLDWDGIDEFGFSALPGGYRSTDGSFLGVGTQGVWWSATESNATNAWSRSMGTGAGVGGVGENGLAKGFGFFVRCIMGERVIEDNTFEDRRDNQIYRTVKIGDQTWMAENLNFAGHLFGESWCYDNVPDSCARYGRLYTWEAAMAGSSSSTTSPSGVQGVCPAGWHLPSRNEWTTLVNFVGSNVAGTRLKSSPPDWNGTDDFGLSALPGGTRGTDGSFGSVGAYGRWWSATESSATNAWTRNMNTSIVHVNENSIGRSYGFSVLCVMTE